MPSQPLPVYRPGRTGESNLAALFRAVGAGDAEGWAKSEAREGIAQLGRCLVLRAFWDGVVRAGDAWIERAVASGRDGGPTIFDDAGPALGRLLAAGADREDLTSLVRSMQAMAIDHVCNVLDDSGMVMSTYPADVAGALKAYDWGLFEVTPNGRIGRPIGGLHESVLQVELGADRTG